MKQLIKRIPDGVQIFLVILGFILLSMILGELRVYKRLTTFLFPAHSWGFSIFWLSIPLLAWLIKEKSLIDSYVTLNGLIVVRRLLVILAVICSVCCMGFFNKFVSGLLGRPFHHSKLWFFGWFAFDWQGWIAIVFIVGVPILTAYYITKAIEDRRIRDLMREHNGIG